MKKILLVLFVFISIVFKAQTLYFKCTTISAPSVYPWGVATNWYQDPLCTTTSTSGIPTSANDVVINSNAFTANGQKIDFDQASMACKGFTVSYAGTFTNVAMQSVPAKVLNVFGHFDLSAFDNSKLSISNWKGDVVFNPANISTLNVLTGAKTLVLNSITIPGNTTTYTVNFNDSLFLDRTTSNTGIINIGTGYTSTNAVVVNFNDLVKLGFINSFPSTTQSFSSILILSGKVNFNNGLFNTLPASLYQNCLFTPNGYTGNFDSGGITARNSCSITLLPQTITNLSYPVARNKNQFGSLILLGTSAVNSPTINAINQTLNLNGHVNCSFANVNFNGSEINANLYTNNSIGWYISNGSLLSTTGSTLNLMPSGRSSLYTSHADFTGGQTYNIINIHDDIYLKRDAFCFTNQFNIFNPNLNIRFDTRASVYNILPGGSMYIAAGTSLSTGFLTGNVNSMQFKFASTSSLTMIGNCSQPIFLNNTTFSISSMPIANINTDYLILSDCKATGLSTPYNAGSNSRRIYGKTSVGWTINCLPPERTLYWQGQITGGNWDDYNNWSLNPLASPSSTQVPISIGACLPTESDSLVFPDQSFVLLNKMSQYSGSVNFIGTSTITTNNIEAGIWNVFGGWWSTNKLQNKYDGRIEFKTFKKDRCIKTGGTSLGTLNGQGVIFSANTPPNISCVPITTVTSGGWILLDTLFVESRNAQPVSLIIEKGNFKTYDSNPTYSSFFPPTQKKGSTIYSYGLSFNNPTYAFDTVKLFDSDVFLKGHSWQNNALYVNIPNARFNEGTAEFIMSGWFIGSDVHIGMNFGNKIDELTIKNFTINPNVSFNQSNIQFISQLNPSSTILKMDLDTFNLINNYQNLLISTPSNNITGFVRRINSIKSNSNSQLSLSTSGYTDLTPFNISLTSDTIISNTDFILAHNSNSLNISLTVRKVLHFNGGGINFKMGNNTPTEFDNKVIVTFSPGASFISDGSCNNRNFISSYSPLGTPTIFSSFNLLGPLNQTLTATDIQDNVVSGGVLNTDGASVGTTTGWVSLPSSSPRLLHWTDGITAGSTSLDWSSSNRWRKALSGSTSLLSAPIIWSTSPECPPLCQDTVVVDNSSFSGILDSVLINGVNYQAQVGKFYWRTTTGTNGFGGNSTANLSICDSLYFSPFMSNKYSGSITLRGSSLPGTRSHGLKMANQILRGPFIINCYNANTIYNMRDSLTSVYNYGIVYIPGSSYESDLPSLLHSKGTLITNSNTLNLMRYTSAGNFPRKLNADGSKIRINRSATIVYSGIGLSGWVVLNTGAAKTYSLSTKSTRFIINLVSTSFNNGIIGGGYNYNDVEFYGTGTGLLSTAFNPSYLPGYNKNSPALVDTFMNVYNNLTGSLGRLIIGPNASAGAVYKTVIKNIYNNTAPMDIQGSHCYIDSLECLYRNNTYGVYNIGMSNDIYKHWGLYGTTAAQQINLAPDSVQWLHNNCEFKPLGNNTNKINFYSTVNGQRTYLRKDSGRVCADWLVLKDIWAVGSGFSKGPVTGPSCTEPVIRDYRCDWDTLSTFDGTGYGPVTATSPVDPNFLLSRRAWFQGGQGTDFQTNNRGWERRSTEADPRLTLTNNNTICEGDTSTIRFTLEGVFPYNVLFNSNTNAPTFPAVSNNTLFINFATPTSYTQTPATATYFNSTSPTGYVYYLVRQNGVALDAGTSTNPFILSIKVSPTVTTQYNLGSLTTGKCINNITTTVTATGNALITVNPAPIAITSAVTPSTICSGSSVTYTANGTYANAYYMYPTPTGTIGAVALTTYTTSGPVYNGSLTVSTYTTGTTPSTYTNYVGAQSVFGCQSFIRVPVTILVSPIPQITSASSQTLCTGNTATINPVNNFTLGVTNNWTSSTVAGITGHATSGSSNVSETLINTTTSPLTVLYTYTPTTSSCAGATQQFSVTVNPAPTMTSITNTTICSGNTTALVLSSNISASTYTWLATDNTNTTGESLTTQSTNTLSNTLLNSSLVSQNVIYTVTPTAVLGSCKGAPQTITVTVNPTPVMTSANTATICTGNTVTIPLTANVASTFSWVATDNTNTTGESLTVQTSSTLNNTLLNGSGIAQQVIYNVAPMSTLGSCIGNVQTLSVTVNPLPVVTAAPSSIAICIGQTATLTAGGANTYTWTSGPTTATYTVNTAGVYTVTGTNTLTGCINTNTVSLIVNPLPNVTAVSSSPAICAGATATLTAAGASTYTWTSGPTTSTYTTSTAGTYTVTGTDLNNCVNTRTVSVIVNANPTLTTTGTLNVACLGTATGSISITASGTSGYSFAWSPAVSTTNTATGLSAGVYTTTVTDVNGCRATVTNTIAAPSTSLTASIATSTTGCGLANGTATVTASGGWGTSYSYVWQSSTSTTTLATGYSANSYTSSVTDANGCVLITPFTIVNPNSPTLTATVSSSVMCSGNSSIITPSLTSSVLSYSVNGIATAGPSFTVTPLTTTVYNINATDVSNCVSNLLSLTITVNATPTLALALSSTSICIGTSATLTPIGADTYTLLNTSESILTNTVVNPTSTTVYTVSGTSLAGCLGATETITLTVNALPSLTLSASNNTICSGNSSTLIVTGADTYSWTTGVTTDTYVVSPTSTTVYEVVGTNTLTNCNSASNQFTVTVNTTPTVTANASAVTVCSNGTISLNASGATTYTWSGTGITSLNENNASPSFTVPTAGTYTYTLLGSSTESCTSSSSTVVVSVVASPSSSLAIASASICQGGTASFEISNPQGGVVYTWNAVSTGTNYTVSSPTTDLAGTYTVNVIAMLGSGTNTCSTNTTGTLTVNATPTIAIDQTNITICDGEQATFNVLNPLPSPASYVWSYDNSTGNSLTVSNLETSATGNYSVTITDANGCVNQTTFDLTVNGCGVFIPEIFSPNGDGKNDVFEIKGIQYYPNNKLIIYNRWGSKVYEKEKYNNEWEGKANVNTGTGKELLPSGTYYVIFEYTKNDKNETYKGYVQLEY